MFKENINGSIKILNDDMENGIISLNNEMLVKLREKYFTAKSADDEVLFPDVSIDIHP